MKEIMVYNKISKMKFQTFESLIADIPKHKQYEHQIKQKRLKKQLSILSQYENQNIQFVDFEISTIGIIMHLVYTYHKKKYFYNLILDFQYPFNRPQIHYVHETHSLAKCKDLIDIVLQGSNWGPSLMLTQFLDKLGNISQQIESNNEQAKWTYKTGEEYNRQYLQQMKIELFQIDQNIWNYMIKFTHKRILGITNEVLLKFQVMRNQNLKLVSWKKISQIKQAKGIVNKKSYTLQIVDKQNNKEYFTGKELKDIEVILGYLNPIEMIERRMQKYQELLKTKQIDETQLVKQLSQLIQFYSVSNPEKAQKYITLMKSILSKQYSNAGLKQKKKSEAGQIKEMQIQIVEMQNKNKD